MSHAHRVSFVISFLVTWAPLAFARSPATQPADVADLRRGGFHISFTDQSPLSLLESQNKRTHIKVDDNQRYTLADESFEVYVPEDYDPDRPWGVLVWVHAVDSGTPPKRLVPLLSQHQLIWIGANNSGNERGVGVRFGLALDAVHNIKKLYNIDDSRVYVSGISGGGKVATMLTIIYPEIFAGAIPIVGTTYFRAIPVPGTKDKFWPGMFEKPPRPTLERAMRDARFVLITGSDDFNRDPIKATYDDGFVKDGFAHVEYVEIPGMEHTMPPTNVIENAIKSLDAPLAAGAKDLFDKAEQLEQSGKLGEAQKLFAQVAAHGSEQISPKAEDRLAQILALRDERMIAAQRAAEEKRYIDAANLLGQLIQQFGSGAPREANELLEKLKADPGAGEQLRSAAAQAQAAQRESAASAALDAARKLVARDLKRGYDAMRKVASDFPGTPAAKQAALEAANLVADPNNKRAIETDPNEVEAQRLLQLAENYERNRLYKEATDRLQKLLRDYPNTKSATKAKQMLDRINAQKKK